MYAIMIKNKFMAYIIVGLGNPGPEYENTRHNTGKMIVNFLRDQDLPKVKLVELDTFMNNSGKGIVKYVKSVKAAEKLVVIYDDFNLPLGKIRISYNRSSGGHNGVESIIKALKTEAFIRIRIGVAPETAKGLAKVPHGDEKIEKFILGKFKDDEMKEIKKVAKIVAEAIPVLVAEGREKAMSLFN
jgi:PTH1 family peptidyl-tRNA hydrolase